MTSAVPAAPRQSDAPEQAPSWLPLAAVSVTLLLWASAFVAIRYLHETFSPGALSLGRLGSGLAGTNGVPQLVGARAHLHL